MKKSYYQIQDEMPLRAKQTLVEGSWTVAESEWSSDYHLNFIFQYEYCMKVLELPCIPLAFDEQSRTYTIEPEFLDRADPEELESFRHLLTERFQMLYDGDSDEIYDEEKNLERRALSQFDEDGNIIFSRDDVPDLPYRAANEDYVNDLINRLVGKPTDKTRKTDDYGWIENRKKIFFENLAAECDRYQLPRFRVLFTSEGKPYFDAFPYEIELMQKLLRQRMKESDKKTSEIEEEFHGYIEAEMEYGNDPDEGDEDPEIRQEREEKLDEMAGLLDAMWEDYYILWGDDNDNYKFPSDICSYPCELLEAFSYSVDMTAPYIDTIGGEDRDLVPDDWGHKVRINAVAFEVDEEMLQEEKLKNEGGYMKNAAGQKIKVVFGDVNCPIPKIMFN